MAFLKAGLLLTLLCLGTCLNLREDRPWGKFRRNRHRQQTQCWKSRPVSRHLTNAHRHMASLLGTKHANWSTILGFGSNESAIVPFETVMKDGYMVVDCVQDKMMTTADKHGDGKWDYKNHAGVSIIFYDRIITDPEEKEAMTPEVCYNFCRTIPDANFFGLSAGRKCYCAPYYEMEASDSSQCDSVCEGDPTQMCGGMKKQTMYSMHMCADTSRDMSLVSGVGNAAKTLCTNVHGEINSEIGTLTTLGNSIKTRAGTNGDPTTAAYGQLALEQVGVLNDGLAASGAMKTDLGGLVSQYAQFQGADFSDADTITDAEELNADTKALAEKATEMCSPYKYFLEPLANGTSSVKAYYPITYWTAPSENRAEAANITSAQPSACEGVPAGGPRVVTSMDECANICDSMVTPGKDKCIAFQYYHSSDGAMCTPLNAIKGIAYYTKGICQDQTGTVKCAAKLSLMKGFDLRVNSKDASVDHVETKKLDRCA